MDGFLSIIKPSGMTSNDLVAKIRGLIRRHYGKKIKVGHIGTLDPNAAGVMILAFGNATKFNQYLMEKEKEYIGEISFGKLTTTLDSYGEILEERQIKKFTEDDIKIALDSFVGKSNQIPPMYSALKVNGQRLYKIARKGQEIKIKPREIEVKSISFLGKKGNKVLFKVLCSSGTYIRTLAKDIGEKLGELAILSVLIRTKVDDYKIEDSFALENIEKKIEENLLDGNFIKIDEMLYNYPKVDLLSGEKLYTNGAKINAAYYTRRKNLQEGLYRVYIHNNFIGVGQVTFEEGKAFIKSKTIIGDYNGKRDVV